MKTLTILIFALILVLGLLPGALARPDAPGDPPPAQPDAPASDGISWRGGVLDENGADASIVVDTQGRPHISYSHNGVRYAVLSSGGWTKETVPGTTPVWITSLALAADGTPHIIFSQPAAGPDLVHAYRDMSGWRLETIPALAGCSGDRAMAVDAGNRVHVAALSRADGRIYHAYRDAAGWHSELVDGQSQPGSYCSLALDAQGRPSIAYVDAAGGSLKLARWDGGEWVVEAVQSANNDPVALAVDSAGRAHIAYTWEENTRYAFRDGGGWQSETVGYRPANVLSLAMAPSGQPRIVSFGNYFERDAAGWHGYGLPGSVDPSVGGLAVDSQGHSHTTTVGFLGNSPAETYNYLATPDELAGGFWISQRLSTPNHGFFFVDGSAGWAMGMPGHSGLGPPGSKLYRALDGGVTWREVYDNGSLGRRRSVQQAFFVDAQQGWISGSWGWVDVCRGWFIAHTADGGTTWQEQYTSPCNGQANAPAETAALSTGLAPDDAQSLFAGSMWFLDSQRGWVVYDNALYRTQDGGQTWQELSPNREIWGIIRYVDANTGFAVGPPDDPPYPPPAALLRTGDGGATWIVLSVLPAGVDALWAKGDGSRLWAVGAGGMIAVSVDGGLSWIPVASPTTANLHHVRFADGQRGWAAGEGGAVLRTTDGGWHWSLVAAGTSADVAALVVTPAERVWIFADGLRRTLDSGASWQTLPHVAGDIASLSMASATAGWAATDRSVLKTTNAGGLWSEQAGTGAATVVDSVDAQHAWVLSSTQLQRTVDGVTWQTIALSGMRAARDLDFADAVHGWMAAQADQIIAGCGDYDEQIYRTQDGGLTWTPLFGGGEPWRCESELRQVVFVDASHGWAAGSHVLLSTTDGGLTWHSVNADSGTVSIDFVDALQGWRVRRYDGFWLERTRDGGATWEVLRRASDFFSPGYLVVDFVTAAEGWVAGDQGMVLYTRDGGATWSEGWLSDYNLSGLAALPAGQAWFGGQNGFIGRFSATEPSGCWATPTPKPPYTGTPPASGAVDRRVAHCMDDAYTRLDTGDFLFDADVVRMGARLNGAAPYATGFLFRDVRIPRGAAISGATLQLEWHYQDGTPVEVTLVGDLQGNAGDFRSNGWQPQLRRRTAARVPWTVTTSLAGSVTSPDISALIAEIVAQPEWQPGNDLAILIDPTANSRRYVSWRAFDLSPGQAARLTLNYTASTTPTSTPTATATPAMTSTPTATATPRRTPTVTPSPTGTATPTPSLTPTATVTQTPVVHQRYLPLILRQ